MEFENWKIFPNICLVDMNILKHNLGHWVSQHGQTGFPYSKWQISHCEKCENKQVILSKPKTFENYLVGNPRKFVSGLQERMNVTILFCDERQYLKHVGAFTHTHLLGVQHVYINSGYRADPLPFSTSWCSRPVS